MQLYEWLENIMLYVDIKLISTWLLILIIPLLILIIFHYKFLSTTAMRSSIEKRMSNYQCCTLTYCFRLSSSLIKQGIAKINTWGTTWTCFTRLKTWLLPLEGSLVFAPGQVFSGLILPFNLGFCFAILLDYLKLIILMISYCQLLIAQGQLYEHILRKQYLLPFCF